MFLVLKSGVRTALVQRSNIRKEKGVTLGLGATRVVVAVQVGAPRGVEGEIRTLPLRVIVPPPGKERQVLTRRPRALGLGASLGILL